MKYEKPRCDCGTELEYREEAVILLKAKINTDGIISKRKSRENSSEDHTGCDWLECPDCGNNYTFDFILKDRKIIRGDLR